MRSPGRAIEVLLVENSAADARLTSETLEHRKPGNRVSVVWDAAQALQFLRREPPDFECAPRPDLILLSLANSNALLAELKKDPDLHRIPVAVLTRSVAGTVLRAAYDLHANCYIEKPEDAGEFVTVVRAIAEYWLGVVTLPGW